MGIIIADCESCKKLSKELDDLRVKYLQLESSNNDVFHKNLQLAMEIVDLKKELREARRARLFSFIFKQFKKKIRWMN